MSGEDKTFLLCYAMWCGYTVLLNFLQQYSISSSQLATPVAR
jgi:hypothetical protein